MLLNHAKKKGYYNKARKFRVWKQTPTNVTFISRALVLRIRSSGFVCSAGGLPIFHVPPKHEESLTPLQSARTQKTWILSTWKCFNGTKHGHFHDPQQETVSVYLKKKHWNAEITCKMIKYKAKNRAPSQSIMWHQFKVMEIRLSL